MKKDYINSAYRIGIAVDNQNGVLLSYDLTSTGEIDEASEGILKELDEKISNEVAKHFDISLVDYGVKSCSESFRIENH